MKIFIPAIDATLIFLITTLPFPLSAQPKPGISGHVRDAQGERWPMSSCTFTGRTLALSTRTASGTSGEYQFDDVPPGALLLEVQKDGFRTSTLNVNVGRGGMRQFDVTVDVAGVNQTVVVTAAGEVTDVR